MQALASATTTRFDLGFALTPAELAQVQHQLTIEGAIPRAANALAKDRPDAYVNLAVDHARGGVVKLTVTAAGTDIDVSEYFPAGTVIERTIATHSQAELLATDDRLFAEFEKQNWFVAGARILGVSVAVDANAVDIVVDPADADKAEAVLQQFIDEPVRVRIGTTTEFSTIANDANTPNGLGR